MRGGGCCSHDAVVVAALAPRSAASHRAALQLLVVRLRLTCLCWPSRSRAHALRRETAVVLLVPHHRLALDSRGSPSSRFLRFGWSGGESVPFRARLLASAREGRMPPCPHCPHDHRIRSICPQTQWYFASAEALPTARFGNAIGSAIWRSLRFAPGSLALGALLVRPRAHPCHQLPCHRLPCCSAC